MLRSLYSGVSGMRGFQTKLDVIGNNIANVNTIGFKASRVMFQDILSQTVAGVTAPDQNGAYGGVNAKQIGLGTAISTIDTVHTQGSAMTTNVPTDLRIAGDGFFMVQDTAGNRMLTRAGNFHFDVNRDLVNSDGLFVIGTDGQKVTLDPGATAYSIGQDGIISQTIAGAVQPGQQIAVAKVTNPEGLVKLGGNLYRETANSTATPEDPAAALPNDANRGTGAIISGQLEMSNVDLTSEFTEMIVAQRAFQANSKIITTSDDILQEVVNLKR
ncbi:flagellar basal body rod protein FlgG [Gordoniibacillus kamchatkensis]|uniref:Flagellar hook protein FlgE n=1 Tax=Gordoniibacillus kamchatkensis TaxID=1590651 RepID=A0ABR5ADX4_9BACL|nr:flagellar basal body rod protein FlgG [Paenibacillus sp. VKM B-2647]KIL39241.1 flagellar basal body rod protein FlgG [Paenibacillus sp. VKM B-2647]